MSKRQKNQMTFEKRRSGQYKTINNNCQLHLTEFVLQGIFP